MGLEIKALEDYTFNELCNDITQEIHLGLIEGGGKGMKAAVHSGLCTILRWNEKQAAKQKGAKF